MQGCKKCGLPLKFIKKGKKWYPANPDGTEHWDLCKETRNKGKIFREKSKVVVGENYIPSNCDCGIPPWEVCEHSTLINGLPVIETIDGEALQHLQSLL